MPVPTSKNRKPILDRCEEDIEIPSIGTSRHTTLVQIRTDYTSDHASNDVTPSAPNADECINESHFEDEHDGIDDQNRRNNIIASPLSRQSSMVSPGGNVSLHDNDTAAAAFATQEREDEAFVQKFWTAYDEILILSLFTQVGTLCRLGAAYGFRYFDSVFHSDSALFTNLPLNCLSCFVMGLLCSGESLMQIILTRFTPPRLQYDLHREAVQQLGDFQEDEMNIYSSDEMDNKSEKMTEFRRNGLQQRGWRRRRQRQRRRIIRKEQEYQSPTNRSSSLNRRQHQQLAQSPEIFDELREVQLLAWERRIRASVCLLLFPVKKEDVDIVENYFDEGYQKERSRDFSERLDEEKVEEDSNDILSTIKHTIDEKFAIPLSNGQATMGGFDDLVFEEEIEDSSRTPGIQMKNLSPPQSVSPLKSPVTLGLNPNESSDVYPEQGLSHARGNLHVSARHYGQLEGGNVVDNGAQDNPHLDQIISNMATGVSNKFSFMRRVNIATGWDVGTSPEEKSEDLSLGLRDGFCGALSSFSSWISSMVNLFREGQIGMAFVGLTLGIQLPIVAYRFGQHVAVYIFVWRCRREKSQDERRGGYGIQLHTSENDIPTGFIRSTDSPHQSSFNSTDDPPASNSQTMNRTKGRRTVHDEESEVPSIRAIFTALFIFCLVAQLTSLNFFKKSEDRLLALSLLFSPLGVLARWRMMKFNAWRPSFPLGTFACNVTACALSGTLGTLLAGNPGTQERIALKSIVAGFGGTLSSVARFIVEILSLIDPILFRFDGFYYAIASVGTGLLMSFLFSASVDWADSVE